MKNKNKLYSFRRCPYAIRARIALISQGIDFELQEVDLKNKPADLLELSPKGTVPVLVLEDGTLIDESLGVVDYALHYQRDEKTEKLVADLSQSFTPALNRFKYADRYGDVDVAAEAEKMLHYLSGLNTLLGATPYLNGNSMSKADIAILPFIRQLYRADANWFEALTLTQLQRWFFNFYHSPLHEAVMRKEKVDL